MRWWLLSDHNTNNVAVKLGMNVVGVRQSQETMEFASAVFSVGVGERKAAAMVVECKSDTCLCSSCTLIQ